MDSTIVRRNGASDGVHARGRMGEAIALETDLRTGNGSDQDVTVVIADPDPLGRAGVCKALEHHGFCVVGEAGDAREAIQAAVDHRPHVFLIDPDLPGDGITAIKAVRAECPETKIAAVSRVAAHSWALEALRAGADGYILKTTAPDRLTTALRALTQGEMTLPRVLTARLVRELVEPPPAPSARRSTPVRNKLLYVPRFVRHFARRLHSDLGIALALESTRVRMREYR